MNEQILTMVMGAIALSLTAVLIILWRQKQTLLIQNVQLRAKTQTDQQVQQMWQQQIERLTQNAMINQSQQFLGLAKAQFDGVLEKANLTFEQRQQHWNRLILRCKLWKSTALRRLPI
jgi:hypothetical protein